MSQQLFTKNHIYFMSKLKSLILLCSLVFFSTAQAQTDVSLLIQHRLGDAEYAPMTTAVTNEGYEFHVSSLRYYISGISIQHDGGQTTPVSDLYLLVDPTVTTGEISLGNFDIEDVEGITFAVGVDEQANHGDPTLWDSDHALAPQVPSMHWGWASGYRFVAFEGMSGAAFAQEFELHGLGDGNYQPDGVSLEAIGFKQSGKQVIAITADYQEALYNIDPSTGIQSHGENGPAKRAIQNFVNRVFTGVTEGEISVQNEILDQNAGLSVFPNPSQGPVTLKLQPLAPRSQYDIEVLDASGQMVQSLEMSSEQQNLELDDAGLYLIQLKQDGRIVATEKVIVN